MSKKEYTEIILQQEEISQEELLKQQVEAIFAEMIKMPEVEEALEILKKLPDKLKYHNINHTLDVIKETILFALADGVDANVLRQQVIAAAWHDVGYIERPSNNEPVAVEMFEKSKAYQNLSVSERKETAANILDTQVVVDGSPPRLLKDRSEYGYLLDADVSNFGRADFFDNSRLLAEELGIDLANIDEKKKLLGFCIALLENHEWKTESARNLRQAQKERNLAELKRQYAELSG